MKRLILLALVAFATWYGWSNYRQLFTKPPSHEAVIENMGSAVLERVRLRVDGQTLAKEEIPGDQRVALAFRVNNESSFELEWSSGGRDFHWSGGQVAIGPMMQRHIFTVDDNGEVMYRAEQK